MANKVFTFLDRRDDQQMELFSDACRLLGADGISIFTNLPHEDGGAFKWIEEILGPELWAMTWVAVIDCPSFAQFMLDITQIDRQLLTKGIGGSPAHKTSLFRRILIPFGFLTELPSWGKVSGEFITPIVDEETMKGMMLEDLPPVLGKRPPAKKAAPVVKPIVQDIDLDLLDLTSDERAFAEQMLSGIGLQAAANKIGMSWQAIVRNLRPSVAAKFKAAGKDFDAACHAAKLKQGELTPV